MAQCSVYHTMHNAIEKTVCILVEKCYHSNLKVVVLMPNLERQEHLNKLLWTYSQKQFIPHGSKLDPLPHLQPVYITDEFVNPNQATVLILVEPVASQFSAILGAQIEDHNILKFIRICIIYSDAEQQATADIQEITTSLANIGYIIEIYAQSANGNWVAT
ncbi:DNA polymerase III subunit chi [Candidatus Trichorickettsia mobilis]|uniref:DNA polymerase III subunit chi n=1 Tax=Candidatus Trichorickettsia mobilis TaxID=1346319 RepID=UPI0029304E82|nr:DNA polymerase III subunit chi [Candidatus Trichorickettsia mobilis]